MTNSRRYDGLILYLCGAGTLALAAWLLRLSDRFEFNVPATDRPLLLTLAVLAVMFMCCYLPAIVVAVRMSGRQVIKPLLFFATAARVVLLWSCPIQEVDLYRYIRDGEVTVDGGNPWEFPPSAGNSPEATSLNDTTFPPQKIKATRTGLAEVQSRVHFPELRSPYPPVSQAVFALSAYCTPADATLETHRLAMKCWIVLFDLGVIVLLIRLLILAGKPVGWAIAYAWCPLVLKEFANSGHLDAITVFFSLAAVERLLTTVLQSQKGTQSSVTIWRNILLSAGLLALATGGKLYPIVLTPLFAVVVLKHWGLGKLVASLVVFLLISVLIFLPMWNARAAAPPGEGSGLTEFVTRWEMNDSLFLVIRENLRAPQVEPAAWFAVTPQEWREELVTTWADRLHIPRHKVSFLIARAVSLLIYAGIVAWLMARVWRSAGEHFLEAVFLSLAWFWLLAPTQNPWYWTWALPFVPFARGRTWLMVSGMTLIYYLRFWFSAHYGNTIVYSTPYKGENFFDLVVTWIEFAPIYVSLLIAAVWRKLKRNE